MELNIRSELAEASLHLVNLRLSEFESATASIPTTAPTPRLARAKSLYAIGQRSAALETLMRVATVAEVFAAERMFQLGFQLAPTGFPTRAWERVADGVQNWPTRREAWSEVFELKLSEFPRWQEIEALTLARNIVAHGLGALTRRQLQRGVAKEDVVTKLARIGITLDGLELVVGRDQVRHCAALVVEFVIWLDECSESQYDRWKALAP